MAKARRFKATVTAITIAAMAALMPAEASAGLKEAMNDMFVTTSTNAQTYKSQRLMAFTADRSLYDRPAEASILSSLLPPELTRGVVELISSLAASHSSMVRSLNSSCALSLPMLQGSL